MRPVIFSLTLITALGGFQFGYNTSVIAGALPFLKGDFDLSLLKEGFIVSIILLGALFGAAFAGSLADRYGRRFATLFTALCFLLGNILSVTAVTINMLLWARFVTGLAVGLSSLIAPLYLAEIAPTKYRGAIVGSNQFAITVGILVAYGVSYLFADSGGWRWMFGLGGIPALIQLFSAPFFYESPRWLISRGHIAKANYVLTRLGESQEIEQPSLLKEQGSWSLLFQKNLFPLVAVGLFLSIFQQITGINIVIYYAPQIFQTAGFSSITGALLATLGIGVVNVLTTLLTVWLIDKVGRRILLIIGTFGMTLSLFLLSLAFFIQFEALDLIAIVSLTAYVAFFALGLGPITWVLLSEIYPMRIRAKAMGVATFANWGFNYLVALTFPDLRAWLGTAGTFCLYGVICAIALWFIIRYILETKGKSLENIA